MKRIERTFQDMSSGQEVAKHSGPLSSNRFHIDYWKKRLYRKAFTRRGERHEVPELSVRLQHAGRREAFALGTLNKEIGAAKAKAIATFLEANGWEATRSKYKPGPIERLDCCTVGQFLAEIQERSHLKPITVRRYAVKLRKMVADIAKVDAGLKGKAKLAKYDYVNGGHRQWLAKVDAQRLDVLNPDSITTWRNRYVKSAGVDKKALKSAQRSAASTIRCARALFASDVLATLRVKIPPYPFTGVKLDDPGPQRYHSETDPEWLLACAYRELHHDKPQEFLALCLCLWGGLRRKEADLLTWEQIDFQAGQIHIRRTAHFEPKTEESQRDVDIPDTALELIRKFKSGSQSEFVLEGGDPDPSATYDYYRCDKTWRRLIEWLRGKGIKDPKAIHMLRKESGSLINQQFGIETARHHLGHRDIQTTSAHYVGKKRRAEVSLAFHKNSELKELSP